nr:MAG TPA: hypothetical protein [Siphoviridae sp. ctgbm9]
MYLLYLIVVINFYAAKLIITFQINKFLSPELIFIISFLLSFKRF